MADPDGALTFDPSSVTDTSPGEGRRAPRRGPLAAEDTTAPNAHSVGVHLHCKDEPRHVLLSAWVPNPPSIIERDRIYFGQGHSPAGERHWGYEFETRSDGTPRIRLLCNVCPTETVVNILRLEDRIRTMLPKVAEGKALMIRTTWAEFVAARR